MKVVDLSLKDFLSTNPKVKIGEMIVECGAASELLKTSCETERKNWSRLFKDRVVEGYPFGEYRVVYISSKSYILYFRDSSHVKIWVVYTEPRDRNLGHISLLLAELSQNNNLVEINTPNKNLEDLARKIGLKIV